MRSRYLGGRFLPHALLVPLSLTAVAHAQQYSKNEITVGLQAQTWGQQYDNNGRPAFHHYLQYPTPSFTYARNLSATLAVEGTVEPWTQFFATNALESGHGTLALGGIKAGWRGKHWGFYGKAQAGIESWSCGNFYFNPANGDPYFNCSRVTNFALEYGGVIERHLFENYALRIDAGHLLSTEFDHVNTRYPNGLAFELRSGATTQHVDLRVGLTKSFGSTDDTGVERRPATAALDLGASFLLQPRIEAFNGILDTYPGPGIWASWNFSQHFSWDTAVIHSGPYRNEQYVFSSPQSGGRALEVLTGLKTGLRRDRMGYFAELRGGTITFGETETRIGLLPDGDYFLDRGMFTNPVLNLGGVWEVYPSRHTILRFDAGSATIFYQPKTIWQYLPQNGVEVGTRYSISEQTQTGLLLTFGAGVRF
jgi:hypothetical protein